MNTTSKNDAQPYQLATEILSSLDTGRSTEPLTDNYPDLTVPEAYVIAAALRDLRMQRDEMPLGWKIGFTNRTIWDEYNVHAPIWAPVWNTTYKPELIETNQTCRLDGLTEPRIEPEIMFKIGQPTQPDMSIEDLISCIDAVSLGFEVVQSIYPGWRFRAPDTIAAAGLHGRLHHGPMIDVETLPATWPNLMELFTATLSCDGTTADTGHASSVLGGPLHALKAFVDGMAKTPLGPEIQPGSIISTGTLTKALPVRVGETWGITLDGISLPAFQLRFI